MGYRVGTVFLAMSSSAGHAQLVPAQGHTQLAPAQGCIGQFSRALIEEGLRYVKVQGLAMQLFGRVPTVAECIRGLFN